MSKRTRDSSSNWTSQRLTIAIALILCCMPTHPEELNTMLDVSRVVPSSYTRDTIAQLPETPPSETISH
jgi:hypothetical protein